MERFDIAIVGAGIAGASLAYRVAPHRSVLLLEGESQPGYHSTGRSAAMFMESYGTPQVRALTRASRAFYESAPVGFTDVPLLAPRGVLYVARPGQQAALDAMRAGLRATGSAVEPVDAAHASTLVPVLQPAQLLGALAERDAMDIDVHALHQGFLRGARHAGTQVWTDARLSEARRTGDHWQLQLADGRRAKAATLVNAAGAWADAVARIAGAPPRGLQPRRRSAFTFAPPAGLDVRPWPAVVAVDESFYFKPDAGQLLGSPANADPVVPHDVQPEELDIATGIAAIEAATTLSIRRPTRTWSGLRTFAPDGDLVIGADPRCEGFFWLAGQGGYGIQSAAGASLMAADLLLGRNLDPSLAAHGVRAALLSPARLDAQAAGSDKGP